MKASTNIILKQRQMLTLSDFKGVDFSSSPTAVQSNRAMMMRNCINEYGQIRKRHGWKEIENLFDEINGIFEYRHRNWHVILIHTGTCMVGYKISNDMLMTDTLFSVAINGTLTNTKSQAFYNNGRLYFVGCGDYYVYGTWDNGLSYKLQLVSDMPDIYIPTTTISISNTKYSEDVRATLDKVNLLTKKRKNKLLGTRKDEMYEDTNTKSLLKAVWILDSNVDSATYVSVTVETVGKDKNDSESPITVELDNVNPSNKKIENRLYCKAISDDNITVSQYFVNAASQEIQVASENSYGRISTYEGMSHIEIYFPTPPVIPGRDNITVTFEHTNAAYTAERISNCRFGTFFGAEGNNDRLFLSGNPTHPNIIFYSKDNDPTYFSDQDYAVLGSDGTSVTGFGRLSDVTLAVYKEESASEATVYFCQGNIEKMTDTDIGEEYFDEIFRIHTGPIGEGLISTYTTASLAGDPLLLSRNGVFGIVLSENAYTTERYARERSRLINARLTQHDLSTACGIVYKNRYYLAVDGVCYIADTRYKTTVNDDIDGSYNYEWWYWDNVPARVWAIICGKLYFGTADGRICVFDSEYTDRTYTVSDSAQLSLSVSQNRITHDRNIILEEGAAVTFEDKLYAIMEDSATIDGDRILSSDIYSFHDGMEVYATNIGTSGLYEDVCYTVTDIEYDTCTYRLAGITLSSGGFRLLRCLTNKTLYLANVTDTEFQLREYKEGAILRLSDYKLAHSLQGRFEHRKNVVAEWFSPMLDLGTTIASKTLLKFTICAEAISQGALSFGYDTRRSNKLLDVKGINRFSLDELSFNDITFDTGFATSYSRKVFESNFNFIRFHIVSDNDKGCAIDSLSVIYRINKQNKGVR